MALTATEREAWQQALLALDALLELPPERRPARLAELQLAPAVHRHVRAMLAAHGAGAGVLDRPCATTLAPAHDALAGRRLGRWRLQCEIGRGGMAVVYRARSLEGPAGQDAAVKVMTLASLAEGGRAQFLREQQTLLRLHHPYIAPLYDAGVADDGTPWLAMARVEGERIDAWCDAHALDAAARVRLLLQVCEAVAHAHRSLVIHRDIKPSNVLVDGDGRVRLLDFGIAHATDAAGERTATALRALTPDYAAPEQFAGAPPTTAMDVYGVGALLYRLLTGVAPRTVRAGADTAATAPSRAVRGNAALDEPLRRAFAKAARGDLDAIVLKALAPEPEARYPGIDALADDLGRWLDGKPVRAQPLRLRYRLRKFLARNRLAAAAAALLCAVLAAGMGAVLWQAHVAREQARQARQAEARTAALAEFLLDLFEASDPDAAAVGEPSIKALLAAGTRRARTQLASHPAQATTLMLALARIHQRLGHDDQAWALLRESGALQSPVAQQQATARMLESRLLLDRAEADAAVAAADAGLRMADGLPLEVVLELHQARAQALQYSKRTISAAAELRKALARLDRERPGPSEARLLLLTSLAGMLYTDGDTQQAARRAAQAWALTRDGLGEPTLVASLADNYAGILADLGRLQEAERMQRQSLALTEAAYPEPHRLRALRTGNLAILLSKLGRFGEAEPLLREAIRRYQHLYPEPNAQYSHLHNSLGVLLLVLQRPADALPHLQIARRVAIDSFGAGDRASLAGRTNVAIAQSMLGQYDIAGRELDALLAEKIRTMGATHHDVAVHLGRMAEHALRAGAPQRALQRADESLALLRRETPPRAASLVSALGARAGALAMLGRKTDAESAYAEMFRLGESAGGDAGRSWPRLLAERAAFLANGDSPLAPAAIAQALALCRDGYGEAHPATRAMARLARVHPVRTTSAATARR